jgi:hypothetical protein
MQHHIVKGSNVVGGTRAIIENGTEEEKVG